MTWDYDSRLLAEQDWAEYQERLWEEDLLEIWEAAQVKAKELDKEVEAAIWAGESEVF